MRHALAAALLLACAAPASAQSVGRAVEAGSVTFGPLPGQTLARGQCGLFIWSKTEQPVFMAFATDQPAEAKVRLGSRLRTLKRTAFEGDRVQGHFARQTFAGHGVRFTVDLTFATETVQDGAVIERGVLRLKEKRGEDVIVPVGGMAACQR